MKNCKCLALSLTTIGQSSHIHPVVIYWGTRIQYKIPPADTQANDDTDNNDLKYSGRLLVKIMEKLSLHKLCRHSVN